MSNCGMRRASPGCGDRRKRTRGLRRPRIRLKIHRSVRTFDGDAPASRSVTSRQRIAFDLVDVQAARLARPEHGFDTIDLGDVDNGFSIRMTDSEHRSLKKLPGPFRV